MDREYDIFEVCPNGDVLWRTCEAGLENARLRLVELGKQSNNPFFAAHTPTQEIVARVNQDRANGARG